MQRKHLFLILIAVFVFKVSLAFYFMQFAHCNDGAFVTLTINKVRTISIDAGDSFSYLGAIDNFIEEGNYYFWNGIRNVYAGRMPYYGSIYYLLRLLADKDTAIDLLIVFQILIDAVALIVFAQFCYEVLKSRRAFWIGFILYLLSFNIFLTSLFTAVESLAVNFIIIFLYFYQKYWKEPDMKWLLTASVFLALATVLRPYLFLIYPFLGLSLIFAEKKLNYRLIYNLAALALPLILLLSPWVIRNKVVLGKFIPTQENLYAGYNYTESELAFRRFTYAWGADSITNLKRSKDYWAYFIAKKNRGVEYDENLTLPPTAYTDGYSVQEVENVRNDFIKLQENHTPELDIKVAAEFDRLTGIYRQERPFMYYFVSPLIITKKGIFHTNSQFLQFFIWSGSPCYKSWHIIFKVVQAGIYLLSLTFGFLGLIYITIRKKVSPVNIYIPFFLISFLCLYLSVIESRSFYYMYPPLVLGLVACIDSFLQILQKKQIISNDKLRVK